MGCWRIATLEHFPEKWAPVFPKENATSIESSAGVQLQRSEPTQGADTVLPADPG